MAKPTPELWSKARALFGVGKSLREIEAATRIPFKTIGRYAEKEGWAKEKLTQLIVDKARVEIAFDTLESNEKDIVSFEVGELKKKAAFFTKASLKVSQLAVNLLNEDSTPMDCKATMDTLKTGMVVSGVVPYYQNSASTTINTIANAATITNEKTIILRREQS